MDVASIRKETVFDIKHVMILSTMTMILARIIGSITMFDFLSKTIFKRGRNSNNYDRYLNSRMVYKKIERTYTKNSQ